MNNIKELTKGEIKRFIKHSILSKYIVLSVVAFFLIFTSEGLTGELVFSFSQLLIVYLGALLLPMSSLYHEKQNNILKSIIVLPVKPYEIIISKILGIFMIILIPYILLITSYIHSTHIQLSFINFVKILLYPIFTCIINTLVGYVFFVLVKSYDKLQSVSMAYGILTILPGVYLGYANYDDFTINIATSFIPSRALNNILINNQNSTISLFLFSLAILVILMLIMIFFVKKRLLNSIMEV